MKIHGTFNRLARGAAKSVVLLISCFHLGASADNDSDFFQSKGYTGEGNWNVAEITALDSTKITIRIDWSDKLWEKPLEEVPISLRTMSVGTEFFGEFEWARPSNDLILVKIIQALAIPEQVDCGERIFWQRVQPSSTLPNATLD